MTRRNAFSATIPFGKYKEDFSLAPSFAVPRLVLQGSSYFSAPLATQLAISTTSVVPYSAFDADPVTFTGPTAFLDSATSTTGHWPVGAISGCAFSPDVPGNAAGAAPALNASKNNGHFILGQNFPNPHQGETTVPFTLYFAADVRLVLCDPQGRKVTSTLRKNLSAGRHTIKLNLLGLGLPAGEYSYQMEISTRHGVYQQHKTMQLV